MSCTFQRSEWPSGDPARRVSGDNERTARVIASELGIDEVLAELRPEDKVAAIERLQASTGPVAMIGDGINDAPALVRADLGIALGTGAATRRSKPPRSPSWPTTWTRSPRHCGSAGARNGSRASSSRAPLAGALTVAAPVLVHEVSELLAVANGVRAARREPATAYG